MATAFSGRRRHQSGKNIPNFSLSKRTSPQKSEPLKKQSISKRKIMEPSSTYVNKPRGIKRPKFSEISKMNESAPAKSKAFQLPVPVLTEHRTNDNSKENISPKSGECLY